MIHSRNERTDIRSQIDVIASFGVSRETIEKLQIYAEIVRLWQSKMNLISNSSLDDLWNRHFADSLQLLKFAHGAQTWVDIGTGAGFPGLPIAIHLAVERSGIVHLVERDNRKCAFLREVARETGAAAVVHRGSAVDVLRDLADADIVTSRAVAPLKSLLVWSKCCLDRGGICLFLKGQDVDLELTNATIASRYVVELLPSRVALNGMIVKVRAMGKHQDGC